MSSYHSYPKIFNVGHKALQGYFSSPVTVEEKIDGSQFSFGIFNGELKARSKGVELVLDYPEGMFLKAVETVKELAPLLKDGYTYRAEFLGKPKHNTLAYDRTPQKHLIIFDINPGEEEYLSYEEKKAEAERLGLEIVPKLFEGIINSNEQFLSLLDNVSVLGGQKIEGVVCKRYDLFGSDKKVLLAKYVSEAFKEIHKTSWKESNPGGSDIVQLISDSLKTASRWQKAVQHLKEKGDLTFSPKDIGNLLKEVNEDVRKECEEYIKDELFKWAWGKISRNVTNGLPQWYKDELVKQQFEE